MFHPLPFYIPFLTEKVFHMPTIANWYPFYIPRLELCIAFNCCKCSLLNINKSQNQEISSTISQP